MLGYVCMLAVLGVAAGAPLHLDQDLMTELQRIVIKLVDGKDDHQVAKLAEPELVHRAVEKIAEPEPESRQAYRVAAEAGWIRVYLQVDVSSPEDQACLPDKCWFRIELKSHGETHTDLRQMHDGSPDGIIFDNLADGEYTVVTSRIMNDEDPITVIENRKTCHKCPLSQNMGTTYNRYQGCPLVTC